MSRDDKKIAAKRIAALEAELTSMKEAYQDAQVALKTKDAELTEVRTEYAELLSRFQQHSEKTVRTIQAKRDFLANMSHDIRTPMNGIIGMLHMLKETSLSEDQKQYADIAFSSAEALLNLVNDILDFSKIEAGKLTFENRPFDLQHALEEITALPAIQAQKKGLDFSCSVAPDVPRYYFGDPGRIRQVLDNLIGNAVKFTPEGRISVKVALTGDAGIKKENGHHRHVHLTFSISDTGIGISEEKLDILFNPYRQADTSISNQFGGTGLGLTIAKMLVEMMNGSIKVESDELLGTTFRFTIKLKKQSDEDIENHQFFPSDAIPRKSASVSDRISLPRILVVEDNATNLTVAIQLLAGLGYRADSAVNGQEALDKVRKTPYDLILMDCRMPVLDGFRATASIRKLEREYRDRKPLKKDGTQMHHTPIVAMTANAMKGEKERCINAGMDGYLTKPVDPKVLAGTLARFLTPTAASSHHFQEIETHANKISVHRDDEKNENRRERPIFDRPALMMRFNEDEDVVQEILSSFIDDGKALLDNLSDALNTLTPSDPSPPLPLSTASIVDMSHALKGAASNVHADYLSGLAQRLENTVKQASGASDIPSLLTLLDEIKDAFNRFVSEIAHD